MLAMGAAAQDQNAGPYAALLREEYFMLSRISDEQLYHLAFTEDHLPFYRHEFNRLVAEAGLQWLADADATRLFAPREPAPVFAFLDQLPRGDQQQYVDFLSNSTGHAALLCHDDVQIRSRPDDGTLHACWISRTPAARGDWAARHPLIDEVLAHLEERRPEFVAMSELAAGDVPTSVILDAYAAGLIDLARSPRRLSGRISQCPTVSPLVRHQAGLGPTVTNQKCEAVRLTDLARQVVTLLDGAHTRSEVAESIAHEIHSGRTENDWLLRLRYEELNAERVADDLLRRLRDQALLVA
jgi:hypothetical protein